jgi:uncharacterized protein YeaO (DUF488 family)
MPIHTRRWDDPPGPDEGVRILVTRYRPRALPKGQETWDRWEPDLGPSKPLHAAAYAKNGSLGIAWAEYRARYLAEMRSQSAAIAELAELVRSGGTVTLLCSSQCDRESRCHRSLLRELIEKCAGEPVPTV